MTKSRRNKLRFIHPSIHEYNDDIMTDFHPACKNKGEANTKACDTSSVSVRGRLQKCLPFWKSLDLIESGYTIPLFETPSTYGGQNNTSACQNLSFVIY